MNLKCLLFSVIVLLTITPTVVRAQTTVTVTDLFAPESPYIRYKQFSTDLQAAISSPPQAMTETTLTGPTYSWSCTSPAPGYTVTGSGNSGDATLNSATPSKSVSLPAGSNSVVVTCTILYISTNNNTGVQTPLSFSGKTTVSFFVRIPVKVIPNGDSTNTIYWVDQKENTVTGHSEQYPLQIEDNETKPQAYGNGLPHEEFSNTNPSGATVNSGGPGTWGINYGTGEGSPSDDFTDNNSGGDGISVHNYSDFYLSFSQTWWCLELTPPYNAPLANLYVAVPNTYAYGTNTPTVSGFSTNVAKTSLDVDSIYTTWGTTERTIPGYDPY